MYWDEHTDNEFDRWWYLNKISQVPVKVVTFFGAGLSMDSPTELPSGFALTTRLVSHLFDDIVARELLETFRKHAHVLGRSIPRLEHLLSVATRSNAEATNLLNIFKGNPPNRNHHIIADYLIRHRAWAVTTNFDECVEQASGFSIPVHVPDRENNTIQVLYGPPDADWGLVKLHGSIGQGEANLAATIESLIPGLGLPVQQLLDRVFSNTDVVLVAGYSGSDHFDINRYLQGKLSRGFLARLIWLRHGEGPGTNGHFPGSITFEAMPGERGPDSFATAFTGIRCLEGDTCELLRKLLVYPRDMTLAARKTGSWSEMLETLYSPTEADRHRIGASFCSDVGLVDLIDLSVPQLRYEAENEQAGLLEQAISLELKGLWAAARKVIRQYGEVEKKNVELLITSNLRRSAKPVRALSKLLLRSGSAQRSNNLVSSSRWSGNQIEHCQTTVQRPSAAITELRDLRKSIEAIVCILDLWRSTRRRSIGRTKLASFMFKRLTDLFLNRLGNTVQRELDAETEIELQLIHLRTVAYGEYDPSTRADNWLWTTIEAERASPDFYTKEGPLIPGFYLNARMTSIELDRVAQVFSVSLAYADALIASIQNYHLDRSNRLHIRIMTAFLGKDRLALHLRHKLYNDVDILVEITRLQFRKARDAAAMLDNDEINRRFSSALLSADQALYGFSTWTRQRIYMSGMTKAEERQLRSGDGEVT